ncbi:polysaccharide deacetylase [Paenibacillus ihbetae]|uniref:Polysaccharide deacetylase n=1 Tax=Paenibacillus ihbetae TaxID=1870820 RepID=A0A1B2DW90_9BACL|nr:polysaccharide deacetylase family protein [Paenibacillus ihbetae]ANY71978.1 polysaccharide deacetylase [Paenibacillus ihbetae]
MSKKRNPALNVKRKNRRKVIKVIGQIILLAVAAVVLINAVFDLQTYQEPDKSKWRQDEGFIALSYFGVGRSGTSKLVSQDQLDAQLKALYDQGYETISQQDVIDYYEKGAPLPDKALFLSFEDGRNDSALFAQPILEKYNFKATFLSYADKMGNSERKFLQPKDMLKMTRTGYWELGTNGYRLTYINIFDEDGRYMGVKDEKDLTDKSNVEYYNHYLMDFIRDENMIPIEDRAEMEARIGADYAAMRDVYSNKLGYVPGAYMIMHANALGEGMNELVDKANTEQIRQTFKMNFSREGTAMNDKQGDLYNLTRVQPAPYWSTNHLSMKLRKDSGQDMTFVTGDDKEAARWAVEGGAAEFDGSRIIVTSPPSGEGRIRLRQDPGADMTVTANLLGNVVGRQSIYVRVDEKGDSFLRLVLENNVLRVEQKAPGQEPKELFEQTLPDVQWGEEDLRFDKASVYTKEQTLSGDRDDDEEYPINILGNRKLELTAIGDTLKISVDGQVILGGQPVDSAIRGGGVALGSMYHEQNQKDDIYDGIFENVTVSAIDPNGGKDVRYTNKPSGLEGAVWRVRRTFDTAVNWAVETF